MKHEPIYWARKLAQDLQPTFWSWIREWGYSGESAYYLTLRGEPLVARA